MLDFLIARVLHVLAVVLWIGGVAMVTTVILPAIGETYPVETRFALFHSLAQRFANQARFTTTIAAASGFYMVWRLGAWDRFANAQFWWMHAMVLTWVLFALMLFVLEPLLLDRLLARRAMQAPVATFRLVQRLHVGLLLLSLLTIAGAVVGVRGVGLFGW